MRNRAASRAHGYTSYRKPYRLRARDAKRLRGARGASWASVIATLEAIALRRELTASRMQPLFLIAQAQRRVLAAQPVPGATAIA